MHRLLVLVLAAVLAAGAAGIARADPPLHLSFPPFPYTFPLELCGFPVLSEPSGDVHVTVFFRDGNLVREIDTFPAGGVTLTNLGTGASLTLVVTGPAIATFEPDGTVGVRFVGPWLLDFDPRTGEENGLFYTTGRVTFVATTEGERANLAFSGRVVDVCALLD